jgi:hypothetical protein
VAAAQPAGHFGNLAPDLAWNTAISFMTNTNWQFYSGESTMSYLSQMAGWRGTCSSRRRRHRDRDRGDPRRRAHRAARRSATSGST